METTGVRILNDEGVQLLRDAGCRVKGEDTVLFPGWRVRIVSAARLCGIRVYNRKGEEAMRLEGRNIYFGMGTDLITTLDMKTGQYRPTVLQDVVNAVKVADACSEIDFVSSLGLASDVPTNAMYVESVKAELENTTKPLMFTAAGEEDLAYIFKMAAAVVGGEDALRRSLSWCTIPSRRPLTQSYGAVRKLFLCADRGIPILYPPGMTMGGTGPITLAGGLVLGNADALAGVVLHQLRHKGSPIVSGFAAVPLDMGAATFCYGAPEFRLTNSAMADICHYYGSNVVHYWHRCARLRSAGVVGTRHRHLHGGAGWRKSHSRYRLSGPGLDQLSAVPRHVQ